MIKLVRKRKFNLFKGKVSLEFYKLTKMLMIFPEFEIGRKLPGMEYKYILDFSWIQFGCSIFIKPI